MDLRAYRETGRKTARETDIEGETDIKKESQNRGKCTTRQVVRKASERKSGEEDSVITS